MVQLTDDPLIVHAAPGRLAEATAWLRVSDNNAFCTAIERSELTST
jgi:hypothetical protein